MSLPAALKCWALAARADELNEARLELLELRESDEEGEPADGSLIRRLRARIDGLIGSLLPNVLT